ncbi:MAG: Kdo hydroxylase family protein [Planctomycetes bacterium]|nr:Kdo hydroxylase family protein [Planctomycetota bacterium]
MASIPNTTGNETGGSLAARLERGELVVFSPCPIPFPKAEERDFLLTLRQRSSKKNISFNPATGALSGHVRVSKSDEKRLRSVLAEFSRQTVCWLAGLLPAYAAAMRIDRVSYRPDEEAIRRLRPSARSDLLHIDAFPSRPTQGWRILRLFVNINPHEPRVWATSETFATLLRGHGAQVGLPRPTAPGWTARLGQGLLDLFQPGSEKRTAYDRFMLRLHHYLKTNDRFQERAPRRFWHFPPHSAWLLFSDGLSHAELRGRYALEHSFLISPKALELPEESPAALLEKSCGMPITPRAA